MEGWINGKVDGWIDAGDDMIYGVTPYINNMWFLKLHIFFVLLK